MIESITAMLDEFIAILLIVASLAYIHFVAKHVPVEKSMIWHYRIVLLAFMTIAGSVAYLFFKK